MADYVQPQVQRLEAGLDWLTLTLPAESNAGKELLQIGTLRIAAMQREGAYVAPDRRFRADGHTADNNTFVGVSKSHVTYQVSGSSAGMVYDEVKHLNPNVTRMDIQLTVWFEQSHDYLVSKHYDQAVTVWKGDEDNLPMPHIHLSPNGGDTLYVGKRTAKQMIRLYNKGVESGEEEFKHSYRYELELKDKYATALFVRLLDRSINREMYISSYIRDFYATKGIILPFTIESDFVEPVKVRHEESTTAKKLQWLKTQVRPTVRRLMDLGLRDYVILLLTGEADELSS